MTTSPKYEMNGKYPRVCYDDIPVGMTRDEFFRLAERRRVIADERLVDAEAVNDANGGQELLRQELSKLLGVEPRSEDPNAERVLNEILRLAEEFYRPSEDPSEARLQAQDRRRQPRFDPVKRARWIAQDAAQRAAAEKYIANHPAVRQLAREIVAQEDPAAWNAASFAARFPDAGRLQNSVPFTGGPSRAAETTDSIRQNLNRIGTLADDPESASGRRMRAELQRKGECR